MKLLSSSVSGSALRPTVAHLRPLRALHTRRPYATAKRRAITPFNENGHIPWTDLSISGKAVRAAQQTFNFGFVLVGVALTGAVGYILYTDVLSTDSKTAYFNRAVDRIMSDRRCHQLLGDREKITAYGEATGNKWKRARPIASTVSKDAQGNEHLRIQFNVEGPKAKGQVDIHLVKRPNGSEYEYVHFFLDVPGRPRLFLEDHVSRGRGGPGAVGPGGGRAVQKEFRFLGMKWS